MNEDDNDHGKKKGKGGSQSDDENQSGNNDNKGKSDDKKGHGKKIKITAIHDQGGSTKVNEEDDEDNNTNANDNNIASGDSANADNEFFPTKFSLNAHGGIAVEKGNANQLGNRFDNTSLDLAASANGLDDNSVIIAVTGSLTLDQNNKFTITDGHGIIVFFKNPSKQFFRGIVHIAATAVSTSDGSERKFHLRAFLLPPSIGDKQGVWTFVVSPFAKLGKDIVIFRLLGELTDLGTVVVTPSSLHHFDISTVGPQIVAGNLFNITVTAKDINGKTVKSYAGTAQITDLSGTVIPSITPSFHDGVFTGTLNITKSHPKDKVTFKDVDSGKMGTSNEFRVISDSIAKVLLAPEAATVLPSAKTSFTAEGLDRFNNEVSSSSLSFIWTLSPSNLGSIVTSGNTATFTAPSTIAPSGSNVTLTVRIDGTSVQNTSRITIVPKPISLDHFGIDTIQGTKTAGEPFMITVRAFNASDGAMSNYTGPMRITDTSGSLNMTVNTGFSNGVWSGNVNITKAAASVKIIVKDISDPSKTATSNEFEVAHGTLVRIELTPLQITINPSNSTTFTTRAFDKFGNEIPSSGLTYQWSLSSAECTSCGSISISGKNATFTASSALVTAANVTLTVKLGSLEDNSKIVIVPKIPALTLDHFVVDPLPTTEIAGVAFPVSFKAVSSTQSIVTTYSGPFDINDTTSTLSIVTDNGLVNGVWTGTVKITKAVTGVSVSVKDRSTPTKTGTSNPFDVKAGNIDHFDFSGTTGQKTAGVQFDVTVTAKDLYSNTVKGYSGTVSLSSNDGPSPLGNASKLPSPYTYNSTTDQGQHTFKVTLYNAKSGVTIAAADAAVSSTSDSFDVLPSVITKVAITPHAVSLGSGDNLTFKAKALDAYGNTISGAFFSWSLSPIGIGSIPSTSASEVVFTAATGILASLSGSITATSGSSSDTASITVTL